MSADPRSALRGGLLLLLLVGCREQQVARPAGPPPVDPMRADGGGQSGGQLGRDAGQASGAGGSGGSNPSPDGPAAELASPDVSRGDATGDADPLGESLVAHWRLDEAAGAQEAADSSGRGNHGTFTGVPPAGGSVTGKQGRALSLRGAGEHVRVASSVSINGVYRSFTISAFFLQDSARPERATVLARQGGYALGLVGGRPFLSVTLEGRDAPVELLAALPAATGRWIHLAAVFDGASVARLFLDGKDVASVAIMGTVGNSTVPITIGGRVQGTGLVDPFVGTLDEVRLHARALSAPEIVGLAAGP